METSAYLAVQTLATIQNDSHAHNELYCLFEKMYIVVIHQTAAILLITTQVIDIPFLSGPVTQALKMSWSPLWL